MNALSANQTAVRRIKSVGTSLLLLLSFHATPGMAATSVSQHGFTWKWNEDRQIGQYCNGDWWVVGPVTITSITPASVKDTSDWTKNGTMVNPAVGDGQGFDSSIVHYGSYYTGNVSPNITGSPLVVATGSVVSAVSKSVAGNAATRPQLLDGAVLTVVSAPPAAGAFRPPMMGSDKFSYWNKSQLNYGILNKLAPVASTPALSTVEAYFERPWFALTGNSPSRYISPLNNMPEYGRDQAHQIGEAMLSLHLNYTDSQKEKLYIRLVQYGIDVYGSVKAGTLFMDNGGLNPGRKAPMVLAGIALNDAAIKEWADAQKHFVFHEDRQTFIVRQSDVGRVMYSADGRLRETYRQEHVGLPEWGEKHTSNPDRDGSNWTILYRHTNGGPLLGNALAISLISGGRATWNWGPFFDYEARFWNMEKNGQNSSMPNAISTFVFNMYKTYGALSPTTPPPSSISAPQGLRVSESAP